jgi:copper chaperone CopZ
MEGAYMKTITIETPALYGDHHVIEVRRVLLELPGVSDVYASSAFHLVEVNYDPEKINEQTIQGKLAEMGYLEEIQLPTESGKAAHLMENQALNYFRHTEVYETARNEVSFAQNVAYSGRPLWNCPGMGVINNKMED